MNAAVVAEYPIVPAYGTQVISLSSLRFDATLGVLSHEYDTPQPISVDVALNLGRQPMLPDDDDIENVLDYRNVRELIIEECTSGHVCLLETLVGRVAQRLMRLRTVVGVRLKITKLEIFPDCAVAIEVESGRW